MSSICGGTKQGAVSEYIWKHSTSRGKGESNISPNPNNLSWIGSRKNQFAIKKDESPSSVQKLGGLPPQIVLDGKVSIKTIQKEADIMDISNAINFDSLWDFKNSIQEKLIGSYALAVLFEDGEIWIACNYKPVWIGSCGDGIYFSSLHSHFPPQVNPYQMEPYSVINLNSGESFKIKRQQSARAVVVGSSGLDSTSVMAYAVQAHGNENTSVIHYNYACKATKKEIESINKIAAHFQINLQILSLPNFGGSSLLDEDKEIPVAEGKIKIAQEWVPARNLLMLSTAVAYAEANDIGHIYLGTNLEEAETYPDNEEQFILDFNHLLSRAVQNGVKIQVHAPLGNLMKPEIVLFGNTYGAPFHLTWSCYRGGDIHCGKCNSCNKRKTAFEKNGLKDPVKYEI